MELGLVSLGFPFESLCLLYKSHPLLSLSLSHRDSQLLVLWNECACSSHLCSYDFDWFGSRHHGDEP